MSSMPEKPIPWWYWPLSPLVMAGFLVAGVVSIPISMAYRRRQRRADRALCDRLRAVGRYRTWSEIEHAFESGAGTLIFEFRGFKDPYRAWYTEDDLVAAAPCPLPRSADEAVDRRLQEYAAYCHKLWASPGSDLSTLTDGLPSLKSARLRERYPRGNIVTLIADLDGPRLVRDSQ